VTSGVRDDVGLLPADGGCVPATSGPGGPGTGQPGANQPRGTQPGLPPSLVIPGAPAGGQQTAPIGPLDPGVTDSGGATGGPASDPASPTTTASDITVPLPLPLPEISVPPLLPELLPGLEVG